MRCVFVLLPFVASLLYASLLIFVLISMSFLSSLPHVSVNCVLVLGAVSHGMVLFLAIVDVSCGFYCILHIFCIGILGNS